ncbi:MAG: twin-arginine translocase TatA/TatE family subunit [Chloroflexi bacterium]|nr:twin-arginine translocase TatA/TatE family subunit [Chloroflexota bacterium]MCI0574764.1 twin-arginine translocase TatA/TatE family subunit [Chloroflexota bacterium]MCI0646403.1 twin-arginine translocase TatA/TatE family subunit [Chloroflexota bacterium]MCI0725504.1 twin-arginine translocase TatA/TatE family subunit [Chloroflexota bacterium]
MDSFFGIGLPELILILVLAGVMLGPHRIRQVARILGQTIGRIQLETRRLTRQLNAELDALDSEEVKATLQEVKELRQELQTLRRQADAVPRSIPQALGNASKALQREGEQALREDGLEEPDSEKAPPLPTPVDVPGDPE